MKKGDELSPVLSVGELRRWLDDQEAYWTQQDSEILGEFENQPICIAPHEFTGGYSYAQAAPMWAYGVMLFPCECLTDVVPKYTGNKNEE